eukprot:GFYU01031918.1.p1 GENE.GFYU01031918.1~~GFYU01031918.1.p1  ORF type:complete len:183 (-),score=19.40 GFYU01031918.1:79-627(-)
MPKGKRKSQTTTSKGQNPKTMADEKRKSPRLMAKGKPEMSSAQSKRKVDTSDLGSNKRHKTSIPDVTSSVWVKLLLGTDTDIPVQEVKPTNMAARFLQYLREECSVTRNYNIDEAVLCRPTEQEKDLLKKNRHFTNRVGIDGSLATNRIDSDITVSKLAELPLGQNETEPVLIVVPRGGAST